MSIVENEMERIKNDPDLQHLVQRVYFQINAKTEQRVNKAYPVSNLKELRNKLLKKKGKQDESVKTLIPEQTRYILPVIVPYRY